MSSPRYVAIELKSLYLALFLVCCASPSFAAYTVLEARLHSAISPAQADMLDEAIAGSGRVGNLHHELEELQQALEDPARADEMDIARPRLRRLARIRDRL